MGGRRPTSTGRRCLADGSAIRHTVRQSLAGAGSTRRGRADAHSRRPCGSGKARQPVGFRSGRTAGCARLSVAQLPIADHQPANGLLRRQPRQPHCATRSKWPPGSARSGRATRRSACALPARTGLTAGSRPTRPAYLPAGCARSASITSASRPAASVRRRGPPSRRVTRCRWPPPSKRPAALWCRQSA
jgi:hypothetical protein